MSWKGFKKAVTRLPHVIQSKTGYSESNYIDQDFDELRTQFEELQQLSIRLHDAASKYREAAQSMLKHQEAFSKVLLEVYEPIPGKFESVGGLGGQTNSMKRNRQLTADSSLNRAQLFQQSCAALSTDLVAQVDVTIERGIIMPTKGYINLHKQVVKALTKRDHKKIDYDRHSDTLKKVKAAQEDERKVMKAQNHADTSFQEFDKYNSLLKTQLPVYIQLRIAFIDPVLIAIINFQNQLFSQIAKQMDPLRSLVDMRFSAVDGFEMQKDVVSSLFRDISLLNNAAIGGGSATGEFDDNDDGGNNGSENKEAATNPFHPSNTGTPAQQPPITTNPFFPIPGAGAGSPAVGVKPIPAAAKPLMAAGGSEAAAVNKKPAPPAIGPKPPIGASAVPPPKPSAVCLFDFDPQQAGDLKLRKGDRLEVMERTEDANGWWRGISLASGEEGLFPGNYVRLI